MGIVPDLHLAVKYGIMLCVLDCNAGDMMDFIKDDIVVEHEPEE